MRNLLLMYVAFIWIVVWEGACDTRINTNDKPLHTNVNLTDTVIKDIPLDKKGRPGSYYRNKRNVEDKLGLTTLENGFDSLQIRIWYGYAFKDSSQLVILKNNNQKWSAELFTFIYHFNERGDSLNSITKEIVYREPKSGWIDFSKNIFELQIMTLPDKDKIKNYTDMMDGDDVIIEVATVIKYRIYSYKEPGYFQDKITEARYMEQILELVETEFNFKRLRKL